MPAETVILLLVGAPSTGFGVYCLANRSFPGWMTGPWVWPLERITPAVAVVEGWSAVVLGLTALAYPFVLFAPAGMRPALSALSLTAAAASLGLVCLAVWLSRRAQPGAR